MEAGIPQDQQQCFREMISLSALHTRPTSIRARISVESDYARSSVPRVRGVPMSMCCCLGVLEDKRRKKFDAGFVEWEKYLVFCTCDALEWDDPHGLTFDFRGQSNFNPLEQSNQALHRVASEPMNSFANWRNADSPNKAMAKLKTIFGL